jgi:uncharacterized protein YbaR (Trm112 family)
MATSINCPVCKTKLKLPRDAEPGTEVECPDCSEVFVPPQLRAKEYDPEEEEGYGVGKVVKDPQKKAKKEKAKAIMRSGRQSLKDEKKQSRPPLIGGIELVLLLIAFAAMLGGAAAFGIAKRFPDKVEGILIIICFCGYMFFVGLNRFIRDRDSISNLFK